MSELQGKVAIVTGAAQGIGRAIALALSGAGANVVVSDLNDQKGEAVVAEIRGQGGKAVFVRTDVSSEESTREMAERAVQEFGRIDILVNCAAIISTIQLKPFVEISKAEWDKIIGVNLTGTFLASKAVVPHMQKNNWGRIINFASATVFTGRPLYLHYVSSKAGIIGMTRGIAKEVGDYNITVNAIAPGLTITEVDRGTISPERNKIMINSRCIKKEQVPSDIVGAVMFFASDASSFITGQTMVVDGGHVFL